MPPVPSYLNFTQKEGQTSVSVKKERRLSRRLSGMLKLRSGDGKTDFVEIGDSKGGDESDNEGESKKKKKSIKAVLVSFFCAIHLLILRKTSLKRKKKKKLRKVQVVQVVRAQQARYQDHRL